MPHYRAARAQLVAFSLAREASTLVSMFYADESDLARSVLDNVCTVFNFLFLMHLEVYLQCMIAPGESTAVKRAWRRCVPREPAYVRNSACVCMCVCVCVCV